jgi:hypothetical protein
MSARWFRFYSDALRNPKVAKLSDKEFRLWVELLALASEHDGQIPPLEDLRHLLKRRLDHLSTGVERLISIGLIDPFAVGYEPHNWSKFQYKSDTSTERVRRHRGKRNVSETAPDTETEVTVAKATDAASASVWSSAVAYLGEKRRPLIGKWCRDFGQPETAHAITDAQLANAADPVAYIERRLRGVKQSADAGDMW